MISIFAPGQFGVLWSKYITAPTDLLLSLPPQAPKDYCLKMTWGILAPVSTVC